MERQPNRGILEILCEAGSVPSPGNLLHDNTVLRAAYSRSLGLYEDLDTAAKIGSTPSAQTFPLVKSRTFFSANTATLLAAFPRSCPDDKLFTLCGRFQINIFYHNVVDTDNHFVLVAK